MSFCIVYICEQLLSLYVIILRSFGVLYKSPSCSSCFAGLHPNQSKLHNLKMLNQKLIQNICYPYSDCYLINNYEPDVVRIGIANALELMFVA